MQTSAIEQLGAIEAAISEGDFEQAQRATEALKPLLVKLHQDDWLALRQRIDAMSFEVAQVRDQTSEQLRQIGQQRHGATAYRDMATLN